MYRLVQKKGNVLLSTSLAWPAVAGCSRAETFSQPSSISFAQPCKWLGYTFRSPSWYCCLQCDKGFVNSHVVTDRLFHDYEKCLRNVFLSLERQISLRLIPFPELKSYIHECQTLSSKLKHMSDSHVCTG